ncbi:Eco57I restriction-modification methylase domain-containing protein [Rhodococcus pyridinivorans]
MNTSSTTKPHAWLDLLQTSGPFLTLPVLTRVFGNAVPAVPTTLRARVRVAAETMMRTAGDTRTAFVDTMLDDAFDWGPYRTDTLPDALCAFVDEHGQQVAADLAFTAPTGESDEAEDTDGGAGDEHRLFVMVTAWDTHPLTRTTVGTWTASPAERLAVLLRARDVPIGLVTDGRWWAIVWAPRGGAMGVAVWDASLFSEEPDSLAALIALLGRARFLGVADTDQLPALLVESAQRQDEITDQLGIQVREAVELLIGTLDQLDHDSSGALLTGVDDDALYSGAVTVMMRIIFVLFAEERRLLPSDHVVYDAGYSIGNLEAELREHASLYGEQTLEHRTGAWHRLLAISRALHSGVAHEDLRLPAYGGTLFDPDIHPWLEGRTMPGQHLAASRPPAIDDRTVLRMLRAVQYVELGTGKNRESRRLTFRALGVEQIGYVYEGLLELEVRTADEPIVHLHRPSTGPMNKRWPRSNPPCEVPVSELATWPTTSPSTVAEQVKKRTGWTLKKVATQLAGPVDDADLRKSLGDHTDLLETIRPVASALTRTEQDLPMITLPGRRYLAPSRRRASTGTHYTPPQLADRVVAGALEPLIYRPGPLETADRDKWVLRPSDEIRDLRIADIAMGSGAFLVAACRYLADRLLEARSAEGEEHALRETTRIARGAADAEVPPVLLAARREVAERCLYGVDINHLAVEMAKLSLWLLTMDPQRPFGFLDDRLVQGDSLLGLVSVEQLHTLHIDPAAGRRLHATGFDFSDTWHTTLRSAADIRRKIAAHGVSSMRDVEFKQHLLTQARTATASLDAVADYLTGIGLTNATEKARKFDTAFIAAGIEIGNRLHDGIDQLRSQADALIHQGRPNGIAERAPLHWPLVFPEIFADDHDPGFDAIIGNPPFLGGKKISGALGHDYLAWLARYDGAGVKGHADLAARFVLRAQKLLNSRGQLAFICTNTLVQGDTLEVGMAQAVRRGLQIRKGLTSHSWPASSASLEIVEFWASAAPVAPDGEIILDGDWVPQIGADLQLVGRVSGPKHRLKENDDLAFQGSVVVGLGFVLSCEEAMDLIRRDSRNSEALDPYIIGQDLNQHPEHSASRWVINFRDWPLERAETYPDLIDIVRRKVKPERDKVNREAHRKYWWRYGDRRPALYAEIANLDYVLAMTLVSNVVIPVRVPTGPVFAHKCEVFAFNDFGSLAVLSSNVHFTWTVRYTSTLGAGINYSPSDVFLTLPRPGTTASLEELGERLDVERRELMLGRGWGLTTTYNHVHDPSDHDPQVVNLREIHASIDRAVFDAYGWSDLDPQIGHHRTPIGTRWTFAPAVRFEVLDRLLEENQRRHAAETA